MKVITFRLLLEQPLLATQLLGDPNSSVSLPYVPGSLLRGMLIHRYLEREQLKGTDDLFEDTSCQRLFFNGSVRYLNAYPVVESGERALPTPLSLFKRKKDELDDNSLLEIYNAAHEDADEDERCQFEKDDRAKPLTHPFCRLISEKELRLYHLVPNRVAVHVLRERPKGRATHDKGAVFRYEAIAENQWFSGAVLVDSDADASIVESLIKEQELAWLGRSRSANYGRVHISDVAVVGADTWREADSNGSSTDGTLSLTLLSDTLLRNANGQHTAVIDAATLSAYLGVSITIDEARSITLPIQVGGYNRTWQLPLPQTTALKAGSVIVFKPDAALNTQQLEWRGMGERRAEGFGRVTFNWQAELHLIARMGHLFSRQRAQPEFSAVAERTAKHMARRLLNQRIEEAIQRYLRDHVLNKTLGPMPANSQLGRVRVLVRRTLNSTALDMPSLRQSLDEFRYVSREQFQRAHFDGKSLWDWLNALLAAPPAHATQPTANARDVWQKLGISDTTLPAIGGRKADLDDDLTYRTALRLIEAVFVAIARKNRREQAEVQA